MHATTQELLSTAWFAAGPPTVPFVDRAPAQLALPAVGDRWHYGLRRWGHAIGSLFGGHRLQPQKADRYIAIFRLSDPLRQRWQACFTHSARRSDDAPCAYLYSQGTASMVYLRAFADLGVNPRHLLHLRHQTWYPLGVATYDAATTQRLETRLKRATRIGHDSVLLVLETDIADGAARIVARVEDSFVVRKLEIADVVQAGNDAVLRRAISRLRRRGAEIDDGVPGARRVQWQIDARSCREFDGIAGDLDRLHGARAGWPLFGGRRRPQLQCAQLRNLVARELSRWGLAVSRLSITFVGRAYAGQALRLVNLDERFEVCDDGGRLIAFGRI